MSSVEAKPAKRHPQPPFTTSTLQQEASRKLGLAPAQTMRVAQRLYEGVDIGGETVGLITYMRTDGVDMAPEAIQDARQVIGKEFGDRYVPDVPRRYSVKAKNAQEAHEAVRPTDMGRLPKAVARHLEPEQAKLYDLIWTRTMASQMESAELERTTVDVAAMSGPRKIDLRATGQVVKFDGFLALYQEGKDDEEDEESRRLPPMKAGDPLTRERIASTQHFTEPPPRYSEASLVKRMEELGIGRPSTYAAVLQTLRDREYVKIEKKRLAAGGQGAPRHGLPRELLPALRRVRFHRRPGGAARPRLQPRDRLEARFCATSGATSRRRSATPRSCAPPTCWSPQRVCSGPTSSPTRATARIRAPARPAAPASCR